MRHGSWLGLALVSAALAACASTPPAAPSGRPATATATTEATPVLIMVKKGASFAYLDADSNPGPVQWEVKALHFECRTSFTTVEITVPAGKKVCVLSASNKNVGRVPGHPRGFDLLLTDQGQFAQSPQDELSGSTIAEGVADSGYYDGPANPGDEHVSYDVWTIPVAATPTAALFPATAAATGPSHEVALP